MTHLDSEFVGDLTKLAAPLATAIAQATITKVFNEAIEPLVAKAAAQAADAQLVAEQAVAVSAAAENVAKSVAADIEALRADIHQRIETALPLGYAVINQRR